MSEQLSGVAAIVMVNKKQVTVDRSTDLSELDAATMKALRAADALVKAEEVTPEESELKTQARVTLSPSSTKEEIGNYIRYGNAGKPLNADETVELAAGDADVALRVLEAENLAHDGNGRKSVTDPLKKLVDQATA